MQKEAGINALHQIIVIGRVTPDAHTLFADKL